MLTFDAVVIGSGPAGLNASLYLVRAGLRTALIEKNSSGGQVLSTSEIENYLGFPKGVKGWELADLFTAHVNEYDVEHIRGEVLKIETIEENGAMHVLHMQNGEQIKTRAVIIATGASSRPLGVPEEETYKGKGVSYCALCDGNFYRGLDVAIVGGGNSALEEALYLSRIVNKIYIIHRREGFRGAQIYLDKIRAVPEKIELVTNCVVDSLAGEPTLKKSLSGMLKPMKNANFRWKVFLCTSGMFPMRVLCLKILKGMNRASFSRIRKCRLIFPEFLQPGIPGRNYAARFAQLLVTARLRQIPPFGIWSS